jgi:hypothetical protein
MSCERQFADLVSEESGDARRCHWQFQEVDLLVLNVDLLKGRVILRDDEIEVNIILVSPPPPDRVRLRRPDFFDREQQPAAPGGGTDMSGM